MLGFVELAWLIVGAVWSGKHYQTCRPETAKKALLGKTDESSVCLCYGDVVPPMLKQI